jgi:hypothetical protein
MRSMRQVILHPPDDATEADLMEHEGLWAVSYHTLGRERRLEIVDDDLLSAGLRGNLSTKNVVEYLGNLLPVDRHPERIAADRAVASWRLTSSAG